MRQVVAKSEPSDEEWHELRKRVKDLGYQLLLALAPGSWLLAPGSWLLAPDS